MQNQSHYPFMTCLWSCLILFFCSSSIHANSIFNIKNFSYSVHSKTAEVVNQTWYVAQVFDNGKYTILRRSAYLEKHPKSIDGLIKMLNQYGNIIEKAKSEVVYGTLEVNVLNKKEFFVKNSTEDLFNYLSALVFTLCEAEEVHKVQLNFPKTDMPSVKYSRKDLTGLGIIPLLDEQAPTVYQVKKGDTFYNLCKTLSSDCLVLKQNNYINPDEAILLKNTVLFICPSFKKLQLHVVQQGETLTKISEQTTTPTKTIFNLNQLDPNTLNSEQEILVVRPSNVPDDYTQKSIAQHSNIIFHTVKEGETLYAIGKKYGAPVKNIQETNDLNSVICPGQVLYIEKSTLDGSTSISTKTIPLNYDAVVHTVKKGETLYKISNDYDTNIDDIKSANAIDPINMPIDRKLIIKKLSSIYDKVINVEPIASGHPRPSTLGNKGGADTEERSSSFKKNDRYIPAPTSFTDISEKWFTHCHILGHVHQLLEKSFPLEYRSGLKTTITHSETGFRFITPIEQINADGTPKKDESIRWGSEGYIPPYDDNVDLTGMVSYYLKSLVTAKVGRYRVFLVSVTPEENVHLKTIPVESHFEGFKKTAKIPYVVRQQEFDEDKYHVQIAVYIFEKKEFESKPTLISAEKRKIPGTVHLDEIGFYKAIKEHFTLKP